MAIKRHCNLKTVQHCSSHSWLMFILLICYTTWPSTVHISHLQITCCD